MLRVSIHAGAAREVSRFNRVDWLDIGYDELAPIADYKVVLFQAGEGARRPIRLAGYPRWSSSLWDLTARALALSLSPEGAPVEEKVTPAKQLIKRCAFASALTVIIQHFPNAGVRVRRLGEMEIVQHKAARGVYRARIDEDLQPSHTTVPFLFAPKALRPAELVLRATLFALTGSTDELPPRPPLLLPKAESIDGKPCIRIRRLAEPARTGFVRWLYRERTPPVAHEGAPDAIAPEAAFLEFLHRAI
jgi:hypothetical protein